MTDKPVTTLEKLRNNLRKARADRVMPLIGKLLDEWDMLPNDMRGMIEVECYEFSKTIKEIDKMVEKS